MLADPTHNGSVIASVDPPQDAFRPDDLDGRRIGRDLSRR